MSSPPLPVFLRCQRRKQGPSQGPASPMWRAVSPTLKTLPPPIPREGGAGTWSAPVEAPPLAAERVASLPASLPSGHGRELWGVSVCRPPRNHGESRPIAPAQEPPVPRRPLLSPAVRCPICIPAPGISQRRCACTPGPPHMAQAAACAPRRAGGWGPPCEPGARVALKASICSDSVPG